MSMGSFSSYTARFFNSDVNNFVLNIDLGWAYILEF